MTATLAPAGFRYQGSVTAAHGPIDGAITECECGPASHCLDRVEFRVGGMLIRHARPCSVVRADGTPYGRCYQPCGAAACEPAPARLLDYSLELEITPTGYRLTPELRAALRGVEFMSWRERALLGYDELRRASALEDAACMLARREGAPMPRHRD